MTFEQYIEQVYLTRKHELLQRAYLYAPKGKKEERLRELKRVTIQRLKFEMRAQ